MKRLKGLGTEFGKFSKCPDSYEVSLLEKINLGKRIQAVFLNYFLSHGSWVLYKKYISDLVNVYVLKFIKKMPLAPPA